MGKTVEEQVAAIKLVMSRTKVERFSLADRLQAALNFYERTGKGDRDITTCRDYYDECGQLRASHVVILRDFIAHNKVDIEGWL